jgi:hypothetical protein
LTTSKMICDRKKSSFARTGNAGRRGRFTQRFACIRRADADSRSLSRSSGNRSGFRRTSHPRAEPVHGKPIEIEHDGRTISLGLSEILRRRVITRLSSSANLCPIVLKFPPLRPTV